MLEVLVYLFEQYYQSERTPEQEVLARKLSAAGFVNEDIREALDWLRGLHSSDPVAAANALEHSFGLRTFAPAELRKLSTEARGFLTFFESAGVLTPTLRELIIDRAMALDEDVVDLAELKVIVLMVLWTCRGSVEALVLEELLPDGGPRNIH